MTKAERIAVLRDILIQLHNGASVESVQDLFNQHFSGVSAIEISLMEQELMNGDYGITFEDVMKLCNVHANLFKGSIDGVDVAESDQPGHPVHVLKTENIAFQAALLRIQRLLNTLTIDAEPGLLNGLKRQYQLLSQFKFHYDRKENLLFPIMERYGHTAPPKVMWGVDDEIRALFQTAEQVLHQFPNTTIETIRQTFDAFEKEFKEMIFKEEAILIPLLLSIFNEDDWLAVANESDTFGYAIIQPEAKWQPKRETFTQAESTTTTVASSDQALSFGGGFLSFKEANLILNHLPFEITFINKDDIFKYFNQSIEQEAKIFGRSPSAIGRHVENCHPPKSLEMVTTLINDFRSGRRDRESMWFHMRGKFVYVTYIAVRDENNDYMGVLEYVHDIQPILDLQGEKRGLAPLE
ncbi:MAG: DUF438 domain-containing protein [Aerococcaceae bacterium]|nr:DUF438 domain-containing protein [Aerococcaceae bacterium]